MAKILTVQGSNDADESTRLGAFEQLNELDTIVLTRIAELSKKEAAVKYFKSGILYETVKAFLK
jgi:hypothetical protein